MGKNLDTKVFKLLKQQRLNRGQLSEMLDVTQKDILATIRALDNRGVDITKYGKRGPDQQYFINLGLTTPEYQVISPASFKHEHHTFGLTSDWHMGCIQHDQSGLEDCLAEAEDMGADFFLHAGDVHDGHRVYRGHLNNLITWSADGQSDMSAEVVDNLAVPVYGIGGNHDYSFTKQSGVRPTKLLSMKTDKWKDLGDFDATVVIGGLEVKLLHGAGGNAYAISYPAQKYLRNLAEGEPSALPEVLGIGHYHTNLQFEAYDCVIVHPGNFQRPNEFTNRRGLRGPRGLYVVNLETQDGRLLSYNTQFLKAKE